jgi:putative endonuclease
MFFVYILYSKKLDRYYVGYTADLGKRLSEHNTGTSTYTSRASDWELKYQEEFPSREEAHKRELAIKKKKSVKYIQWLISQQ